MVEEVNSSMIYLIHCKNFCKCFNVSPPSTTINFLKSYVSGKGGRDLMLSQPSRKFPFNLIKNKMSGALFSFF
jgi:hypothetical protein